MLDLVFDIVVGMLEEFMLEALSQSFRLRRQQEDTPSKSVLGLI
jgi:hypothetical protein